MPVWPPFCDGVAGGVPHQAQGVRGLPDGPWEFPEVSGAPGTCPPTLGNQGGQAGALRAGAPGFSVRVTGPVWAGPCSVSRPCSQAPPPDPALPQGHAAHTGRPACRTPGLGLPHTTPKAPRGTPNPGAQAGNLGNSWPCPGPPVSGWMSLGRPCAALWSTPHLSRDLALGPSLAVKLPRLPCPPPSGPSLQPVDIKPPDMTHEGHAERLCLCGGGGRTRAFGGAADSAETADQGAVPVACRAASSGFRRLSEPLFPHRIWGKAGLSQLR